MAAKKTIAIVGSTGTAGSAIATRLAANGYRLILIAENSDKLTELAAEITKTTNRAEVEIMLCVKDGCWEADIIILAIPDTQEKEVAEKIKEVATQKIIIRTVSVNSSHSALHNHELQQRLLYSKIIIAFTDISNPDNTTITGADEEAETVADIAAKASLQLVTATGRY